MTRNMAETCWKAKMVLTFIADPISLDLNICKHLINALQTTFYRCLINHQSPYDEDTKDKATYDYKTDEN